MRNPDFIQSKIYSSSEAAKKVSQWRALGKTIVFTNGCFDILHKGHISSLSFAARQADYLIVGLNSDASTKRLKGAGRPVNDQDARALLMASLVMVDAVVLFEEDTPRELITSLLPDILVKGGDYTVDQIAGAKEVIANGGRVIINPIVDGYSTSLVIENLKKL